VIIVISRVLDSVDSFIMPYGVHTKQRVNLKILQQLLKVIQHHNQWC